MIVLSESSVLLNATQGKLLALRKNFKFSLAILFLDVFIGIFVLDSLPNSNILYTSFWSTVDNFIEYLDSVITWITNNPAGLKLNEPVNTTLSSFVRYHIYLWKTFVEVLRMPQVVDFALGAAYLGASTFAALTADIFQILTLHILCFDAYASKLSHVCWSTLVALWGLVRGKKWNPLRKRTDNVVLESREQFIGTSLFTILLFLLPTILVYFVVFRVLRISVRLVLGSVRILARLPKSLHDYTLGPSC
ncbi:unnamed protein product [Caenorhabditis auriculariae]|uniref:Phosphatidylinositol N-acetylglucosaminyltransferase subunit Q n=1 Tax=Caenorhabditis auriculariae TaxID=2777116 RepID=A0A8S1HSJ9_9PELO|nr:unnamed protein product [Caenorhabditis auriculariae]